MASNKSIKEFDPEGLYAILHMASDEELNRVVIQAFIEELKGKLSKKKSAWIQAVAAIARLFLACEMEDQEDGERAEPAPTV